MPKTKGKRDPVEAIIRDLEKALNITIFRDDEVAPVLHRRGISLEEFTAMRKRSIKGDDAATRLVAEILDEVPPRKRRTRRRP